MSESSLGYWLSSSLIFLYSAREVLHKRRAVRWPCTFRRRRVHAPEATLLLVTARGPYPSKRKEQDSSHIQSCCPRRHASEAPAFAAQRALLKYQQVSPERPGATHREPRVPSRLHISRKRTPLLEADASGRRGRVI